MLQVTKLYPEATIPTCVNPGEDLGYDLYALQDTRLPSLSNTPVRVHTGIAATFTLNLPQLNYGLLIRDRSSMAMKGLFVVAGVIDAGYRGEIVVAMHNFTLDDYAIKRGDKIAQLIPLPVLTDTGVNEVAELPASRRGGNGFGSSGR